MSYIIDQLCKRIHDNLTWEDTALLLAKILSDVRDDAETERKEIWEAIDGIRDQTGI